MEVIYSDFKKGEAKIKVTSLDDLWYLSHIIDEGDSVKGQTLRKIKSRADDERAVKSTKKTVFIIMDIEKVEFHKYSDVLRVSGVIKEGPEDVQKGEHHTFNVEINTIITIIKTEWLKFQKDKLKEASSEKTSILIVVMDREDANFAITKQYGYDYLSELRGEVQKKGDENKVESKFYSEIENQIKEYVKRHKIEKIIVASPAFWKEDLLKTIKDDELKKNIVLATCSSADKSAISEVLKRQEVQEVLKQGRIAKELKMVEDVLKEISKDGPVAYGLEEVKNNANLGSIKTVLLTDDFIKESREKGFYEKIDGIMKLVDQLKGEVHIISSEHDGGKKLNGLGGIAALLRYKT
ncbi:mRNA surveillance protein pelota [Nanoarchaeota archaeon]